MVKKKKNSHQLKERCSHKIYQLTPLWPSTGRAIYVHTHLTKECISEPNIFLGALG